MLTLPLCIWLLLYPKLHPFFVTNDKGKVTQEVISSSLGELASSSLSSLLLSESPSSSSSSDAFGKGEGDSMEPPRWACHLAIQPTQVFTWHNSSLSVSRQASMHCSYAMTSLRVTPPTDEKGVDVEGAEEAGGAANSVYGRFGRS